MKKVLLLLLTFLSKSSAQQLPHFVNRCLTGYMTDVQSWVEERGDLSDKIDASLSLDLSSNTNPTPALQSTLLAISRNQQYVKYLSMARCGLIRVPKVFDTLTDSQGRTLAETVQYLTLYGNTFIEVSTPGDDYDVTLNATNAQEASSGGGVQDKASSMWFNGFQAVKFEKLKELDLRACGIKILKPRLFHNMVALEALYLGENNILSIQEHAFNGLPNLLHLDVSRNFATDLNGMSKSMLIESADVFTALQSLQSADFSYTKMNRRNVAAFRFFAKSLKRLSMCHVGPLQFGDHFFKTTSLKILDLSGNYDILSTYNVLLGLESTLQVLHAIDIGLNTFDIFKNFRKLEVLRLNRNEIVTIRRKTAETLVNLKVLDLKSNRIGSWFTPVLNSMPSLEVVDMASNNINVLSEEMLLDFSNVSYVGLAANSLVCNCYSKDLIKLAARNEMIRTTRFVEDSHAINEPSCRYSFHLGFEEVNNYISLRKNISYVCDKIYCGDSIPRSGEVLLLDYSSTVYTCFLMKERKDVPVVNVIGCDEERKGTDLTTELTSSWNRLLILLLLPGLLLPALLIAFIFRKNLRYFYVTMRNSAMISMVNKNKIIDDDTIFNYDVFVSYCNEDRPWVLDQLLGHLENDCSVSLCLHERDFQVGLSILENIVSCMDRSKFILLVISQQFLLSQWCQFEMHLAQHRLLETRREDLILILLEDIPRRLRPNTLHYLMLTKTYIVWPKNKDEQKLFWKRLKKSLVNHKQKTPDNVSLA